MRKMIVVFALMVSLLIPATAGANSQIAHRNDPSQDWLGIAQSYWASKGWFTGECDADTIRVIWTEVAKTIYGPVDLNNGYGAFTYQGGCLSNQRKMRTIWFNSSYSYPWWQWCTITVHEYGHLIGLDHSVDPIRDPDGIMSGPYIVPACIEQDPSLT